jgi:hypothetical protein
VNLDNAVIAHSIWKSRFRAAIMNAETLDSQTISKDDCCELGIWLYGDGKRRYGGKPEFSSLVEKHKNFHNEAGDIAVTINAKKFSEAQSMIGGLSPFGAASAAVIVGIARLKEAMV